jgi:hypothetical protein
VDAPITGMLFEPESYLRELRRNEALRMKKRIKSLPIQVLAL